MKSVTVPLLLLCICMPCAAALQSIPGVSPPAGSTLLLFHQNEAHLDIHLGAQRIARYVWNDHHIKRPFFSNVCAADGTQVTRNHPPHPDIDKGNDDHADFHPGIWLAFGDIGGADNWRLKTRVRHGGFLTMPAAHGHVGGFAVTNLYENMGNPPKVIAKEICRYTFEADAGGYFLLSQSIFTPVDAPLSFGDQEEMGFGIRLATGISVKRGGIMANSHGGENESGTWGKAADWCWAHGNSGNTTLGVLLSPGAGNFRPSWFHNRDYGLMVANPFGRKAMTAPEDLKVPPDSTIVAQGDTLNLDFGVYVFSTPAGDIPDPVEKHERIKAMLRPE